MSTPVPEPQYPAGQPVNFTPGNEAPGSGTPKGPLTAIIIGWCFAGVCMLAAIITLFDGLSQSMSANPYLDNEQETQLASMVYATYATALFVASLTGVGLALAGHITNTRRKQVDK